MLATVRNESFLTSVKRLQNSRFLGRGAARGAPGPVRFLCILLSFPEGGLVWTLGLFPVPWTAHMCVQPLPLPFSPSTALVWLPKRGS